MSEILPVLITCGCDEEECCMYNAQYFGPSYGFSLQCADLPDELQVNWTGRFTGTVIKSGCQYTNGSITLKINEAGDAWILEDTSTDPKTIRTVGLCLIRENSSLIQDKFEESYRVVINGGIANNTPPEDGFIDIVVNRVSLCEWFAQTGFAGEPEGVSLSFSDSVPSRWTVGASADLNYSISAACDGPQNQPNDRHYREDPPQFNFNFVSARVFKV